MTPLRRRLTGAGMAGTLALLGFTALAHPASAATDQVYGVTADNRLVIFSRSSPSSPSQKNQQISGLQANERIVGIDVRPATGELYAVTDQNRVYVIDTQTTQATLKSTLTTALSGKAFDIDFNPTVDRLRVVSDAGQNLRVNVDTGATTVDGTLAYASGDPNAGATPRVVGAAYTNPVNGATTTSLYDTDSGLDVLATQNPPNNGTLNTVGSLGTDISKLVGFDVSDDGKAYVAALPADDTQTRFYSVDLSTGQLTEVGPVNSEILISMALSLAQAPTPNVPEFPLAALGPLLALAGGGVVLVRRRTATA